MECIGRRLLNDPIAGRGGNRRMDLPPGRPGLEEIAFTAAVTDIEHRHVSGVCPVDQLPCMPQEYVAAMDRIYLITFEHTELQIDYENRRPLPGLCCGHR